MEKAKIDRINELARRVKAGESLTEAELAERAALRTEYLAEVRASMTGILDHSVIVRPDGTRELVKERKNSEKKAPDRMQLPLSVMSNSEDETRALGIALARLYESDRTLPPFIAMYGDLGVGKTAFVSGFAEIWTPGRSVRSPTFALVNEYRVPGRTPLFHFDMYRITSDDDLYSIGYDDYLDAGICLCEWSENIPGSLPARRVEVRIEKCASNENDRRIEISVL